MNIQEVIKRLDVEIKSTQKGLEQEQSLVRLKEVAKQYQGDDKVVPFESILEKIKSQKDELKIHSGWSGLDALLNGFRLKQLIVVSALTKSGKTSFLMDLSTKIKEHNPLWLSYEESVEELIRRCQENDMEPPRAFTPESMASNKLEWVETKIIESIAKYDTRVVFIDQLDFLIPYSADNRSDRIGDLMRSLKAMARKWNVVIFLVCHLVKSAMDTQPTLEDLKGSSSIGQEADTVILLWREMKRDNGRVVLSDNVNVSVQANRRTGRTGNVSMVYVKGRFIESDWRDEPDADAELIKSI